MTKAGAPSTAKGVVMLKHEQMSRMICPLVLLALGCAGTKVPSHEPVEAYKAFLAQLDRDRIDYIEEARTEYVTRMAGQKASARDLAFLAFRGYYYEVIETVNDGLERKALEDGPLVWGDPAKRAEEQAFECTLSRNGLAWLEETDVYFVAEDESYLSRGFADYVSRPIRAFLEAREAEMHSRFQYDGSLRIPFREVGSRCVNWERYLDRYPDGPLKQDAEWYYRTYVRTLLVGTTNTRVVWSFPADPTWRAEVESAYKSIIGADSETRLGSILEDYLVVLERSDFRQSDEIAAFLRRNCPEASGYLVR